MTIVHGQIESLKRIKEKLNQSGITRFNSIGEINDFIKNYESEKHAIYKQVEHKLNVQINDLQESCTKHQQFFDNLKTQITNELNDKIKRFKNKFDSINAKSSKYLILQIFYSIRLTILKSKKTKLEKNFTKIIHQKTYTAENKVISRKKIIDDYKKNKEKIISERCLPKYKELAFIKKFIEELNPLIAGAIGENLVVKELEKLSDKYILFNDFSMDFKPPIYNKKENDRIFSIQIDHLLVADSGIFILETKNWSKKSIENYDLRSPIKQIMRTSYALFKIINSDSKHSEIDLKSHHWGNKKIPVRNIVVMINEKPKEEFKYVKVQTLSELNSYISYFDSIFNDSEVKSISDYLRMKKN